MPEDRIGRLAKRFQSHGVGRKPTSDRTRERRSFYLDTELVERLDMVYRDMNHQLYPTTVSKSAFLETLIEYGLNHLSDLKTALSQIDDTSDPSD